MSWRATLLGKLQPASLLKTTINTVQILAAIHLVNTSIVDLRLCYGFSMLPTMSHEGTWVLVSPLYYWSILRRFERPPERGDLVFATNPLDRLSTVCKRIVGVEGDLVEVEVRRGGHRKWIDDQHHSDHNAIEGDVVRSLDPMIARRKGEGKWVKIPKGHVWLAGDNMSNSTDSRTYGPVPLALVKGKVIAQVGPCLPPITYEPDP
jgi:inner membrane protease subunit 1